MKVEFSNFSEKSFLTKLWSRPQMYDILTYLQRKLVNYNFFVVWDWKLTFWRHHFVLPNEPNCHLDITLWKHTYSNILKILQPKKENFQIKKSDIFHISAQNIDCGYSLELPWRGSSNKYPQYTFWAEIRKIVYTPINPSFTIWKWGLRGSKLYRYVFVMKNKKLPKHIYFIYLFIF